MFEDQKRVSGKLVYVRKDNKVCSINTQTGLEKNMSVRQIFLKNLCRFQEHIDPPGKYVSNRETPTPPNIEIATPQS